MQYLLIHTVDDDLAAAWDDGSQAVLDTWLDETTARKVKVQGNRVRPAGDATTVKVRGGKLAITDGPFAETKEQLAGYGVLECANLDEAVAVSWAAKHPTTRIGSIEVRALFGGSHADALPDPEAGTIRNVRPER